MVIFSEHFKEIEKRAGFPEEAIAPIEKAAQLIDSIPELNEKFTRLVYGYMTDHPDNINRDFLPSVEALESYGAHKYTLDLVYIMACSEILHERYRKNNIPDEVFWQFTIDFRCKLIECMECKGVVGTFVAEWVDLFYSLERFGLGRFQYEHDLFPKDYTTKSGYFIKEGTPCVNMHIPSMGIPLTDEVRMDSYKKAYEFFKDRRTPEGYLIMRCGSWLLFPKHPEFLDANSNILKFYNDFEVYEEVIKDSFNDDWRIWNKYAELPLEERPADTKLRKAYKDWMMAGNKTGYGRGVIVFDGEKII